MRMKYAVIPVFAALSLGFSAQAGTLEIDSEKIEAGSKTEMQNTQAENLNNIEEKRSIFDVGSTDLVTISEGVYDVQSEYLDCQIEVPFGWLCLTQDFKLQYDTFAYIYQDPLSAAKDMVSDGMHFFLLDYDFENTIEIYFSEDYLGTLVGTAAELDDEDNAAVFQIVNENYFPSLEGEVTELGNKRFYHFWNENETAHFYETYVNGICVDVFVKNLNGEAMEDYILQDAESLLSEMSFPS